MTDISKERLAYLRQESWPLEDGEPSYVTVRLYPHELRALLDAADERDRLRAEVDALDDDPDPEDTARQERLDSLVYHPPVPKDPY